MKKIVIVITVLSLVIIGLSGTASIALAAPGQGDDFVCPVIASNGNDGHGIAQNPVAGELGIPGYYTVVPATANNGHLNIPDHATNMDGTGSPLGPFAAPGDTDYSAVWNGPHP